MVALTVVASPVCSHSLQEKENPIPKFGIIVPLAPFGMPDYDETERFDLRVGPRRLRLSRLWVAWPASQPATCCSACCCPACSCPSHVYRLLYRPLQLPFVDFGDPDPELENDPLGLKQLGKAFGFGKKKEGK